MNKRFLSIATISVMVAMVFFISMTANVAASPDVVFKPTDDVDVTEGYPDSNQGGTDYNMYVGWSDAGYQSERFFLKFDLSSVPDTYISSMDNAVLRIMNNYGPSQGSDDGFAPENLLVDVKGVDHDGWDEDTLTWNYMKDNMLLSPLLDSELVLDDTTAGLKNYYYFEVTGFIENEILGDNIATLAVMSENAEAENKDATNWFYTKDADNEKTQPALFLNGLTIPYREPKVSPEVNYRDVIPGGTVTISENITNQGDNADNIVLDASDDAGWSLSFPNKVELAGNSSTVVDLTVTVPDNAAYRVLDNVQITAHSKAKPSFITTENVEVYTSTWLQPPDDDRHLVENQDKASSGDSVYWLYVGANAYDDDDNEYYKDERIYLKFNLENGGLPSDYSIDNTFLYLYAYDVSDNEAGRNIGVYKCDNDEWSEDNISTGGWPGPSSPTSGDLLDSENVTDEGYYKWDVTSWIQNQRGVDNVVSFVVKAENEEPAPGENFSYGFASKGAAAARPFDFSIANEPHLAFGARPTAYVTENDEGGPGDSVTVDVVVNNRGALNDSYNITIENTSPGWSVSPSSENINDVAPGENGVVSVTVDIPSNADWRDNQELKVTVTSQTDTDYVYETTEFGVFVGQASPIDLIGDWNLVGFPVVNDETTVQNLFAGSGVNYFDTTVLELRGGSLSVVSYTQVLEDNRGYFIKSPSATTITCP